MDENKSFEQPYERFITFGPESLSDYELLAIIIRTGYKGADAIDIAKQLLKKSGDYGLLGIHHLSIEQLISIRGIGEVKAVKLKCIAELSNRISKQKRSVNVCFNTPTEIAEYFMERMRHLEREKCLLALFNSHMELIKDMFLSIGTVNASIFSTREIFKEALNCNAVYFAMLHNHPSGFVKPSNEDIELTKKVQQASKIMDILLIDHIIIGDNCFFSFKEHQII